MFSKLLTFLFRHHNPIAVAAAENKVIFFKCYFLVLKAIFCSFLLDVKRKCPVVYEFSKNILKVLFLRVKIYGKRQMIKRASYP
jgi:hypothetical protein